VYFMLLQPGGFKFFMRLCTGGFKTRPLYITL
jgi:hypothetical protein